MSFRMSKGSGMRRDLKSSVLAETGSAARGEEDDWSCRGSWEIK